MTVQLRPYQQDVETGVYNSWAKGSMNVLAVMPTGAGKTVLFSKMASDNQGGSCVMAHRQELVSQISMALARCGVKHRIVAARATVRQIIRSHMKEFKRSFFEAESHVGVASVDTLLNRHERMRDWCLSVTLWVQDEAHHVLKENKWGKVCEYFPNAKGLGVTATPTRADGMGLGRHADGIFDDMVVGPTMRDLINMSYLTEYRVICPSSTLDLSTARVSKTTGDYNPNDVSKAVASSSLVVTDGKSRVVGDVVQNYVKFANGKLGVAFAPDVTIATQISDQFNTAGIPSSVVSAKTPQGERESIIERFRNREIMVLVNVDLFGEGFDLPAIEVVMMARPTKSYSLYVQQFGRALRLMDGKDRAIIIDHVGNIELHKLPDVPREWTLDRREKRSLSKNDAMPLRVCTNELCLSPFERFLTACPHCGESIPEPAIRSGPEYVDGDLFELDDATLARMRSEASIIDHDPDELLNRYRSHMIVKGAPYVGKQVRKYAEKLNSQREAVGALRDIMAWWAGHHRSKGRTDSEIFRIFYITFGVDWLGAQALESNPAFELGERVAFNMGSI